MHLMVNNHEGRKPSADWIRHPGRPRRTCLNLVQEDVNAIRLSTLWRAEIAMQWSWSGVTVCIRIYATMVVMMMMMMMMMMKI